jgi:hypothetical protein
VGGDELRRRHPGPGRVVVDERGHDRQYARGKHFLQEDSGAEIGALLVDFADRTVGARR